MAALIAAAQDADYPATIATVISNRPDAPGLARAAAAGIPTIALDHRAFPDRESLDMALRNAIEEAGAELVACAGYMRVMTPEFVTAYAGRMINIHPALLPLYRGLNTHARALADGTQIHGCTVHFVTPDVDCGPIIAQAAVPVLAGDTPVTLAARVNRVEVVLYPDALARVAAGEVWLEGDRIATRDTRTTESHTVLFSPPLTRR